MNDLALAVINTGSHYQERRKFCPITPIGKQTPANSYRHYVDKMEKLCVVESRAEHYEGRVFTQAEIRQAAREVADYMIQHMREG